MCQITFMQLQILLAIQGFRNPFLDQFFKWISIINNYGILIILLILGFVINKNYRRLGLLLAGILIANTVLVDVIVKPLMAVPRPFTYIDTIELLVKQPLSYSFPSGHTASMFCLAISLFYVKRKWGIWAIAFAVLMGFSRLYLFVHFPLDVLAGALVGWITAEIGAMVNKRFCIYQNDKTI